MYVTTGSGSSGKYGGGGKGGREEFPRHQETLATTTAMTMAMAMATRTSKSDSFDEKLTKTTLHVWCTREFPLLCYNALFFHSLTQATLREPTFPTFPFITRRIVYLRNKKMPRLEGWPAF